MTRRQMLNIINNIDVYEKISETKKAEPKVKTSILDRLLESIYGDQEKARDKSKKINELYKKLRH